MNNNETIETLDFNDLVKTVRKRQKTKKKIIFFRILPEIFIPILTLLAVISSHSTGLIKTPVKYIIMFFLFAFLILFISGFFFYKSISKKKKSSIWKILVIIYTSCCLFFMILLYSPYKDFRNWLISTAMATMNHQYLCKWFYNDKEIAKVLGSNYVKEINEKTNKSLINTKTTSAKSYANAYEEQVLKHSKNEAYKIIKLDVNGCNAYLAVIYDASKVKVAATKNLGYYGQNVTDMASDNNALLAINGGGFYDPGNTSSGGMPTGITISNGEVVTNNNYSTYNQYGGLIGFTNDNVLVLMKGATATSAINAGVRDAISWGPFLIVNGKKSFIKGNGGWGYAARTAIGQRKDGIVLLLTVDSNATRTNGADMVDLTDIMSNYGAVNAANLDGGTSTVMVLPKKEALNYTRTCEKSYCYINDPIDGGLSHRTRAIADAIIVTK